MPSGYALGGDVATHSIGVARAFGLNLRNYDWLRLIAIER